MVRRNNSALFQVGTTTEKKGLAIEETASHQCRKA
jgi:hypothetical protein